MAEKQTKKQADKEPAANRESDDTSFSEPKDDKLLPFFNPLEEEFLQAQGLKDRVVDQEPDVKPSARDIFGKWGDEPSFSTSYPPLKEKGRRDAEDEDNEDDVEEELYRSRKHASKKEEKSKKKEKKEKEKEKSKRSASPSTSSREKEHPLFPGAFPPRDSSPVRLSASREDFELKISSLEEVPGYVHTNTHVLEFFYL